MSETMQAVIVITAIPVTLAAIALIIGYYKDEL